MRSGSSAGSASMPPRHCGRRRPQAVIESSSMPLLHVISVSRSVLAVAAAGVGGVNEVNRGRCRAHPGQLLGAGISPSPSPSPSLHPRLHPRPRPRPRLRPRLHPRPSPSPSPSPVGRHSFVQSGFGAIDVLVAVVILVVVAESPAAPSQSAADTSGTKSSASGNELPHRFHVTSRRRARPHITRFGPSCRWPPP